MNNSKRMEALKVMLKEDGKMKKKKRKELATTTTKSSSTATSSDGSVSTNGSKGKRSIPRKASARALLKGSGLGGGNSPAALTEESVSPKGALKLLASWEHIRKTVKDYEMRVGEELFLAMLELKPDLRHVVGISSLRSPEFTVHCRKITAHIDYFVHMTGPSCSQELIVLDIGDQLQEDKIDPRLLVNAIPAAMKVIFGADAYTPELADVWGYTFAKHVIRMTTDDDKDILLLEQLAL